MPTPTPPDPADWPAYCCAILRDASGRYLLERRPATAAHAPGLLTCFGGKRERGERPEACIVRELREELGWDAGSAGLEVCVRLLGVLEGREGVIAWFYRTDVALPALDLPTPPGVSTVWVEPRVIGVAPLSGWHRAALEAERVGQAEARVG